MELGGAQGPVARPAIKHIAAHVEDHPLDYAGFQGSIPDGQYGAGTVETWDRGTWEPLNDPDEGMRKGELNFVLPGQRLNGRFHLVRLKPKPDRAAGRTTGCCSRATTSPNAPAPKPRHRAGHARAQAGQADSAKLAQIRQGETARHAKDAPAPGAKRGKLPATQAPQLCAVAEEPPNGNDWLSEIKFDGYRLLAWIDHGKVRLVTRNGHDWTDRLPAVARAVANSCRNRAAGRRTRRARQRRHLQLPGAAGGAVRRQGRHAVSSTCSICCISTAGTCAAAPCWTASACCKASTTGTACCATATTTPATPRRCGARPAA